MHGDKKGTENQVISFIGILADIFGIFSFSLMIAPAVIAFMTKNIFVFVIAVVLFLFALVILFKRKKLARGILSLFLNLTAPQKNYKLIKKEVIYEFVERTKMRHEKNFFVKVLDSSFTGINDKYKWTGGTPLSLKVKDPQHFKITQLESKFGLERYNIDIKGDRKYSAGQKVDMGSIIEDIQDPQAKSSLHLSAGIYEKTDRLILKVLFDPTLQPINARRLEYIHYNDDDHYWSGDIELELDGGKKCLKWVIDKPLYGGKYMIEWEF